MGKRQPRRKIKEEHLIHIDEDTKKRLSWSVLFIALAIVVIFFILLFLGIKVRFELGDELNPIIEPNYQTITVNNKDTATVNFSLENQNFIQCNSLCTATLYSYKDQEQIFQETYSLNHKERINIETVVSAPGKGSGLQLYNLEISCSNVKSLICLTEEEPRHRSAILALDYRLSENEAKIKESLMNEIKILSNYTSQLTVNYLALAKSLNDMPKKEKSSFSESLKPINIEVDEMRILSANLTQRWNEEDYIGVDKHWDFGLIDRLYNITQQIITLQEKMQDIIDLRNNNIDKLKSIKMYSNDIARYYDYLILESNDKNTRSLLKLKSIADSFLESVDLDNNNKSQSEINKTIVENTILVKGLLEEHTHEQIYGTWLIGHSRRKMEIKGEPSRNVTGTICEQMSSQLKAIYRENEKASARRKSLNLTINQEHNLTRQLTRDALLGTNQSYININEYQHVDLQIENISDQESLMMTDIETIYEEAYLDENCYSYDAKGIDTQPIIDLIRLDFSALPDKIYLNYSISENPLTEINENLPQCCTFNECIPCRIGDNVPVLFIHGHSFNEGNTPEYSMNAFTELQRMLESEKIINFGELDLTAEKIKDSEWGKSNRSISVRASYYYIAHYSLGSYDVTAQKSESIESYAIRLREIIELLKERTGSDKVTVIAHSMGGLVLREYGLLFGYDSIDKGILINTPNNGVTDNVAKYCSVLGSNKECDDLTKGSIFLSKLNAEKVPDKIHAIRSIGCDMANGQNGDGIVTETSAYLDGAENYLIRGECTDALESNLHSNVLDPNLYPETYELIVGIIS